VMSPANAPVARAVALLLNVTDAVAMASMTAPRVTVGTVNVIALVPVPAYLHYVPACISTCQHGFSLWTRTCSCPRNASYEGHDALQVASVPGSITTLQSMELLPRAIHSVFEQSTLGMTCR
jgi:hypothetical protein